MLHNERINASFRYKWLQFLKIISFEKRSKIDNKKLVPKCLDVVYTLGLIVYQVLTLNIYMTNDNDM